MLLLQITSTYQWLEEKTFMSCSCTVLMPFPHFSSQQNLEVALTHHCFACLLSKASHKAKLDGSGPEKGTTNILNNTICQVSSMLISVITPIKTSQPYLFFYLFCPSLTNSSLLRNSNIQWFPPPPPWGDAIFHLSIYDSVRGYFW